jgi:hypothetical protein
MRFEGGSRAREEAGAAPRVAIAARRCGVASGRIRRASRVKGPRDQETRGAASAARGVRELSARRHATARGNRARRHRAALGAVDPRLVQGRASGCGERRGAPRRRPGEPVLGTREKPAEHAFRGWAPRPGRSGGGAARGDRGPVMRRRVRPRPPREWSELCESAGRRPARRRCASRVKGRENRRRARPRVPREACASEVRDGARQREEIGRDSTGLRSAPSTRGCGERRRPGAGRADQPWEHERSLPDMRFEGGRCAREDAIAARRCGVAPGRIRRARARADGLLADAARAA